MRPRDFSLLASLCESDVPGADRRTREFNAVEELTVYRDTLIPFVRGLAAPNALGIDLCQWSTAAAFAEKPQPLDWVRKAFIHQNPGMVYLANVCWGMELSVSLYTLQLGFPLPADFGQWSSLADWCGVELARSLPSAVLIHAAKRVAKGREGLPSLAPAEQHEDAFMQRVDRIKPWHLQRVRDAMVEAGVQMPGVEFVTVAASPDPLVAAAVNTVAAEVERRLADIFAGVRWHQAAAGDCSTSPASRGREELSPPLLLLSPAEWRVLDFLAARPTTICTMIEIAVPVNGIGSRPTVSKALKGRLLRHGLVEKHREGWSCTPTGVTASRRRRADGEGV